MNRQEYTNEQENKKAVSAAMQLLLCRQRTEKELRQRLQEKGFSEEAEEEAIAYVRSFGYLNDRNYAEVYLHSQRQKKSRSLIRRELLEKGVAAEWIDEAFAGEEAGEGEVIYDLLCKRAGDPHALEEKERNRQLRYLAGKGFAVSEIWKQMRRYEEKTL